MIGRMGVAGTVLFLAGCAQVGDVNRTSFYTSHRMRDFFQKAVARENARVESTVPMVRTANAAADKTLSISFQGDDETRRRIVQEYKRYAMSELQTANLSPFEDSVTQHVREDMLCDFDILYSTSDGRTDGLLRTSSVVDQRGYVVIEVHLLEYKGYVSR